MAVRNQASRLQTDRTPHQPFRRPDADGLGERAFKPFGAPWPELIISAGRRNEPLVRWIQRQAGGPGSCKLVHVGRPWALHECFDLIVTSPQYRLAERPNILQNEAPLHRVNRDRLTEAAARWAPRFADLREPRISVLLGGNAGPYIFDRASGALLGWYANRMAETLNGSLLITTSARTPPRAVDALMGEVSVPSFLYRWRPNDPENPYYGMLALADRHIVTADTMSMLVEACTTERPVFIFDFSRGARSQRPAPPPERKLAGHTWSERLVDWRPQPHMFRFGQRYAPKRLTRDVTRIHARQVSEGRAVWLGQDWHADRPSVAPMQDLERAVARVRALFDPEAQADAERRRAPGGPPILPPILRRFFQ